VLLQKSGLLLEEITFPMGPTASGKGRHPRNDGSFEDGGGLGRSPRAIDLEMTVVLRVGGGLGGWISDDAGGVSLLTTCRDRLSGTGVGMAEMAG
jgi:hypothetical protein